MKKTEILILDDDDLIRGFLEDLLSERYLTRKASCGESALSIITEHPVDLVMVDYNMPDMNGLEYIRRAREIRPDCVFIIMSGNKDITTAIDAVNTGVWHFVQKPFRNIDSLFKVIDDMLERQRLILENRRYRDNLETLVQQRTEELEKKNSEILQSRSRVIGILSRAAEFKDYETGQHFIRVSRYSGIIASGLGLQPDRVNMIEQAAPVHDIGKIGIPESILLKQGKLSSVEFEEMKRHCLYGEEILKSQSLDGMVTREISKDTGITTSPDELLATAAQIAKSHHERFDGSGYPCGLKGEKIPLEARIVAVADVYDALGSDRHYKKSWQEKECRTFIQQNTGVLFDPEVVTAFLRNSDRIMDVKMHYQDRMYLHTTA
jgi:putative two-component system response regulator